MNCMCFFLGTEDTTFMLRDEAVRSLDAMARKEIVDYVIGLGLTVLDKDAKEKRGRTSRAKKFNLHNFGWNKRLKTGMQNFLAKRNQRRFEKCGFKE